jgi:AraC family transcriptional regulator
MSLINRALFVIERNLDRELSLAEIASACTVSRFHLAHSFGEATGLSVMEYVRGRRLSEAAGELESGATDILALALKFGYASHEAFTRAFKTQFGMTPEAVRAAGSTKGLALLTAAAPPAGEPYPLKPPKIEKAAELKFVGLRHERRYGQIEQIPAQWRQFMSDYYSRIEHRSPSIPVGISADGDEDGNLFYICAAEVTQFGRFPPELTKLALAAATYAVFSHEGHVTALPRTYWTIWNDWFAQEGRQPAAAPSFERHNPQFDTRTGEGGLTIWIPIEQ